MSWNYRVIAFKSNDEIFMRICEVYYDENKKPNGYIAEKVFIGDSVKGLNWTLNKMKLALKKPILSAEKFPEEFIPEDDYTKLSKEYTDEEIAESFVLPHNLSPEEEKEAARQLNEARALQRKSEICIHNENYFTCDKCRKLRDDIRL